MCWGGQNRAQVRWCPLLFRHIPQNCLSTSLIQIQCLRVNFQKKKKNKTKQWFIHFVAEFTFQRGLEHFFLLLPPPGLVVADDVFNLPCAVLVEQRWGNLQWNHRLVLMLYDPSMTPYILITESIFDSFSFASSFSVVFHYSSHTLPAFLIHTISLAEIPVIARTEPQLELCPKGCLL